MELDVESRGCCVSPYSEAGSYDSGHGADCGSSPGDVRLERLVTSSLREEDPDDDDSDDDGEFRGDVEVMCEEDRATMILKRPGGMTMSICGEEWISWTAAAVCPCCRRDASDDSIDLQEMIKLEPIRVRTSSPTTPSCEAGCGSRDYTSTPHAFSRHTLDS